MKEEIIGIFTFGITFFGSSHNTMIDCFGFFLIDQPIVPFPSVAIPLNTLLAYILRLWHTGIIVESTNVMPVHLPKASKLRKNMSWNQLHKAVVRHSFRKIKLHRTLNEEQVVVLEIAECTEIQQNGHDFTVGQRRLATSTLRSAIVFQQISCIFCIKMFAKLVYNTK